MTDVNVGQSTALAHLLAPTDLANFLTNIFEVAPHHVERGNATYFDGLYSRGDLETALHVGSTVDGHIAMTKDGTVVESTELLVERPSVRARYTGRPPAAVLDSRAVAAHYDRGHTLFVKDAGLFSPRLHALCNRIQRETLIYVQANAYLTPANQRGFGLHYDTHDTLVLQIEGTKCWRVHEPPVKLPIESQPSIPTSPTSRSRTFDLHAGDTLYLPRGFPHECTAGAETSLHLTLALLPVRVVELAEAALRIAAISDVELRRSLELGWQDAAGFPERLGAFLAERLRSAFTGNCLRAARELVINELFATTRTVAEDALGAIDELHELTASTRVALRNDGPFLVRDRGANIELVEAGKVTTLPSTCARAITALVSGAMTVAAIEALIPGSGVALVRLLVLDGIATLVPT